MELTTGLELADLLPGKEFSQALGMMENVLHESVVERAGVRLSRVLLSTGVVPRAELQPHTRL